MHKDKLFKLYEESTETIICIEEQINYRNKTVALSYLNMFLEELEIKSKIF